MLMKPFYLRIYRSGTYTAGNETESSSSLLLQDHLSRAQTDVPAVLQNPRKNLRSLSCRHLLCGCADRLEYDRDGSCFSVIIADRQRNPLTHLRPCFDDDKLSRQAMLRNARSFYYHLSRCCPQAFPASQNLVHNDTSIFFSSFLLFCKRTCTDAWHKSSLLHQLSIQTLLHRNSMSAMKKMLKNSRLC